MIVKDNVNAGELLAAMNELNWKQAAAGALIGAAALTAPIAMRDAEARTGWTQAISTYRDDQNVVGKVLAGEAGGEGHDGMYAVACVIQNRGGDPKDIVLKKHQFSALIDPGMMERNYKQVKKDADEIAFKIGSLKDVTGGATNYVTKSLYNKAKADPAWAKSKNLSWILNMKVTKTIGNHVFLKGA